MEDTTDITPPEDSPSGRTDCSPSWWIPHPLDCYGQLALIEIAHSASPPDEQPQGSDWCADVVLDAKDGWKVAFFYDCGELDYIDYFVTPDGTRLEVWPDDYGGDQWPPVMNWRSMADTERFRKILIGE